MLFQPLALCTTNKFPEPCPCHQCTSERSSSPRRLDLWSNCLLFPRDPGSPKLRMVSWNLNTFRFGGDYTPLAHQLTFGEPGIWSNHETIPERLLWNLQNCPKILWINCLHLIRFRPKSGTRTVFGTSFPKRPMVMRLFSWLQQEDTVVGSPKKRVVETIASRNRCILLEIPLNARILCSTIPVVRFYKVIWDQHDPKRHCVQSTPWGGQVSEEMFSQKNYLSHKKNC